MRIRINNCGRPVVNAWASPGITRSPALANKFPGDGEEPGAQINYLPALGWQHQNRRGEAVPERRPILLTVCLGAFMATLDSSIVNIALPQMARDFHSSLAGISWVMVIYLLVNVALLLTSGRLGDLLAPGRLYLLGLALFTGSSGLCGVCPGGSFPVRPAAP